MPRPNVLLICTDQQRYDSLGCYGNAHARTPNVDELARQGVVFGRCYTPSPVIATVTILTFLAAWNNFFMPLVFTFSRPDLRTLSVGMLAFVGEHETDWPGMAAGATISLIPVTLLFFFAQRYYVEGIAGAIKS